MPSLSFLVPYLALTFVLLLLAVAIAMGMDWLEDRKRMRGVRVRYQRTRALARISDPTERSLAELAIECERRRRERKNAGAVTPAHH